MMKPEVRRSILLASIFVLVIAVGVCAFLFVRRSPLPEEAKVDLAPLRETLQAEAARHFDPGIESGGYMVVIKPGAWQLAQQKMREQALLPLEEKNRTSRWLFQGSPEEAKRLESTLSEMGRIESRPANAQSGADSLLLTVVLQESDA